MADLQSPEAVTASFLADQHGIDRNSYLKDGLSDEQFIKEYASKPTPNAPAAPTIEHQTPEAITANFLADQHGIDRNEYLKNGHTDEQFIHEFASRPAPSSNPIPQNQETPNADTVAAALTGASMGAAVGGTYGSASILKGIYDAAKNTQTVADAIKSGQTYESEHGFHPGASSNAAFNEEQRLANEMQSNLHGTQGYKVQGNSRIITPNTFDAEKYAAEQAAKKTAEQAAKKTLGEKVLATGAKYGKYLAPTGIAGKVINAGMPILSGAGAGAEFADAYNRAKHGDYGRAAVSTVGGLGSLAAMIPTPYTRGIGTAVAVGAPLLNAGIDTIMNDQKPVKKAGGGAIEAGVKAMGTLEKLAQAEKLAADAAKAQTVTNAQRVAFPGIYKRPDVIAKEAAERVAPESGAMKQLFGVTRDDLYEMNKGRIGNELGLLPGAAKNPKGSAAGLGIMNPRNEQRILDVLGESEKYPALVRGMDPWYVMDPMYKRLEELVGPDEAVKRYKQLNTLSGMASPGSDVLTEINRGSAANYLQNQGRFSDFLNFGGAPETERGSDFPADMLDIMGHPYHPTAQAGPMDKYLQSGIVQMKSPKVPAYIQASGVPETGFQTDLPVGDAHWSRAVGLGDTRTAKKFDASVSNSEMAQLAPWWREKIASPLGIEAVPAQARTWGAFAPQTGVESPIGSPKLELWANKIIDSANKLGIPPEVMRDQILLGKDYAHKEGGLINLAAGGKSDYERLKEYEDSKPGFKDYLKVLPKLPGAIGSMIKEQYKSEPSYKDPYAPADVSANLAADILGTPGSLLNMMSGTNNFSPISSENFRSKLENIGVKQRPLLENALMFAPMAEAPIAKTVSAIDKYAPAITRSSKAITFPTEAVAPDLGQMGDQAFKDRVTYRLLGGGYGSYPTSTLGNYVTDTMRGQGTYRNLNNELELNPMKSISIKGVSDLSKAPDVLEDVASMGKALNQEAMAGMRFLPKPINSPENATAAIIKNKNNSPLTNEQVRDLADHLSDSMVVSHNPHLGGVYIAPFGTEPLNVDAAKHAAANVLGDQSHIQYGISDLNKDRIFMPDFTYGDYGARAVPPDVAQMRNELKDYEVKNFGAGGMVEGAEAVAKVLSKLAKPEINRIDMNFKDVTKRIPELTEAAKKVSSGDMSASEYDQLVNAHKPVTPYAFIPQPATAEDAARALTKNKLPMYGKTNEIVPGEQTDLRLDIPAYRDHGVWINSIHRQDAPTVYGSVSSVKNANMIGSPDKALKVATGESSKSPFAVIRGEWNPVDEQSAIANAQNYLGDPSWRQVGYDPERHGYFYDRHTMDPIEQAEEVLQIGPLVLAKNPKYGSKASQKFKKGGLA